MLFRGKSQAMKSRIGAQAPVGMLAMGARAPQFLSIALCAFTSPVSASEPTADPLPLKNDSESEGICQQAPRSDRSLPTVVTQGQTLFLPEPSLLGERAGPCRKWRATSPMGQDVPLQVGEGLEPVAALTFHETGVYRIENPDGETFSIRSVDWVHAPFENLNYYPSQSVVSIGDEIWTADVFRPTLTVVSKSDWQVEAHVPVGSWPVSIAYSKPLDLIAVAQKGEDALGIVSRATRRIQQSILVGDEPTTVVISPDGFTAFVALATQAQVVEVDLKSMARRRVFSTVRNPLGLAVSGDGKTLFVSSYRSLDSSTEALNGLDSTASDHRDLDVISLTSGQVIRSFRGLGSTLRNLRLEDDDHTLVLSGLQNPETPDPSNPTNSFKAFQYNVTWIDASTGTTLRSATAEPGQTPWVATNQSLSAAQPGGEDLTFVTLEAQDTTLVLEKGTGTERLRIKTPGRPRSLASDESALYVHGHQGLVLTRIDLKSHETQTVSLGKDNRPTDIALGNTIFTGAGTLYAADRSCNSCHLDAIGDGNIYKVSPVDPQRPKPIFWATGTYPIGVRAYTDNIRDFAQVITSASLPLDLSQPEVEALSAYLSSLLPPPEQNVEIAARLHDLAHPDGADLRQSVDNGRKLFTGLSTANSVGSEEPSSTLACAGCHTLPLGTSRVVLRRDNDPIDPRLDIPSIVGAGRFASYFSDASAIGLEEAVGRMMEIFTEGPVLTHPSHAVNNQDAADIAAYVRTLGHGPLFVLSITPRGNTGAIYADGSIEPSYPPLQPSEAVLVEFSRPLDRDTLSTPAVTDLFFEASDGTIRKADVTFIGPRTLRIAPTSPFPYSAQVTLQIPSSIRSFDGRSLANGDLAGAQNLRATWQVADQPRLKLTGSYTLNISRPVFNPQTGVDETISISVPVQVQDGARIRLVINEKRWLDPRAVVSGDELFVEPFPPPRPSFDGSLTPGGEVLSGLRANLIDADGDGIADRAAGTYTLGNAGRPFGRSYAWSLERAAQGGAEKSGAAAAGSR